MPSLISDTALSTTSNAGFLRAPEFLIQLCTVSDVSRKRMKSAELSAKLNSCFRSNTAVGPLRVVRADTSRPGLETKLSPPFCLAALSLQSEPIGIVAIQGFSQI